MNNYAYSITFINIGFHELFMLKAGTSIKQQQIPTDPYGRDDIQSQIQYFSHS